MSRLHVLIVNLPHPRRIQRRIAASYEAPNFLTPPTELMGLDALLRAEGMQVTLVDAIAEELGIGGILGRCGRRKPDLIVTLPGFACLDEDLDALGALSAALGGAPTAVFGHLPTVQTARVAGHAGVDFVLLGEPEETLLALCRALRNGDPVDPAGVPALASVRDGELVQGPPRARIRDLDRLPFPDHGRVPLGAYGEPLMPGPIGAITTARGCPYPCSFCVRTYGRALIARSVASLLDEVDSLLRLGVRHIRFLDDTFTADRARTLALCAGLSERAPITWTCLTRLDRLDGALCLAMAGAGCRRAYVGIESADADVRDALQKGLSDAAITTGVRALRDAGISVAGFFMVGDGDAAEVEARASAAFAVALGLHFVIATRTQRWPGTPLGDGEIAPPAALEPQDGAGAFVAERALYRRFYGHPRTVARHLGHALRHPTEAVRGALLLGRWAASGAPRDFI